MYPPSRANFLSRLTFSWMTPLVREIMRKPLQENALPPLPTEAEAARDTAVLRATLLRCPRSTWGLTVAIARTFAGELFRLASISLILIATSVLAPLLLRHIILGLSHKSPIPTWFTTWCDIFFEFDASVAYPIACSLAMFANAIILIISAHNIYFFGPMLGARCRSALNAITFDKALRQARSSHQSLTTGFVVNLIGADSFKVQQFAGLIHLVWYHPAQLVLGSALLYALIGFPAVVGIVALFGLLFISASISRRQATIRRDLSKVADKRIGLTNEALVHIKAAKFQGWEENLSQKISDLRSSEVQLIRRLAHLSGIVSFSSGSAPAIAMAATCATALAQGVPLDAATIFPVLSLFMILRFAVNHLPDTLFNFIGARVALQRIASFLAAPEHEPHPIDYTLSNAVELTDATFNWSEKRVALTVPKLLVPRGELVVVVGGMGSGKSALLLGILGEIPCSRGAVKIGGTLGYVPQTPWIVSDTVRGNILAGQPFDEDRYRRVVSASGLDADLASLPQGDLTEIGERGVNLSGGQRHRVALARTYYAGADSYLLDDPLSALDPRVANHVFNQLIRSEGTRATTILVTHRIEYALMADTVIVIEGNAIAESGTPLQLRRPGTRFSQLLDYHEAITGNATESATELVEGGKSETIDEQKAQTSPSESFIVQEERQVGRLASGTIRAYMQRLAPGVVGLILGALFIGRQLAAVAGDVWLAHTTAKGISDFTTFMVGYLACVLALCVLVYARSMFMLIRGLAAGVYIHNTALHSVLHAPMRFFESNPVGRILNRFSRDLETVEIALPRSLIDAIHCLGETFAAFIMIVVVAPTSLVVVAPVTFAYFALQRMYRPLARESQRLASVTLSPVFAVAAESLAGLETLRAARLSRIFQERFFAHLDAYTRVVYTQTAANRWLGIRLESLGSFIILVVGISASLSIDSGLGIAFSGLVLSYTSFLTGSMNWAIRSISMVESSLTSYERLQRYTQIPSERLDGEIPPAEWPHTGHVRLCGLSVRYRPELPLALQDVRLEIPSGARVGIVGRTGSGKSTLILSMMRLVEPAEGHVEVDGRNLSSIALSRVRSAIAIVPQEPVLFSGRLRESLDPFSEYSDDQIIDIMHRVQLSRFLQNLPRGLDTRVREGGFNFSSGQRQLICLARALLRRSRVVILDEATASIDVETDYSIQQTIRSELAGATMFVIAHRLGTVLDSDIIVGLQDGRLLESGPPSELLARPDSLLTSFVHEISSDSIEKVQRARAAVNQA